MTQQAPPAWLTAAEGLGPAPMPTPPPSAAGAAPPPVPGPRAAAPSAQEGAPASSLTDAFRAGALTFKAGEQVPVKLADGKIGTVDAKDASHVIDSGGEIVPHDVLHAAQMQERYGGAAGGIGAAGAGFARGLTVGLSDPVALGLAGTFGGKEAKESLRERLNAYKELHPYASVGGEIAGVVAPALLSGGAGAVGEGARVAGSLNEGIGLAGRAGEGLARSLVGEGAASLGARTLQAAVRKGAAGAVEGALYGAGSEISEASLGDTRLTGEKLLASMGHGALLGGAFGAGIGATGELGKAAIAKAQPFLRAKAEEQAWKGLNPLKKFTKEAEARAGGTRAIGRTMLDEGIFEGAATSEDLLPKIGQAKERVGKELSDAMTKSGALIPGDELAVRVDDVIGKYRGKAGFEPLVKSLEDYQLALAKQLGGLQEGKLVPVQSLFEQRKALDTLVYQETKALDPNLRVAAMRQIRGVLADTEIEAIDHASKSLGGITGDELKALRKRYQHLSIAESAAEDATSRMQTNRNFSLSDYATAGAMLAGGHPLGAIGALAAHKGIRESGNAFAATHLDKLAALGSIENRAAEVDKQLEGSIASFFRRLTSGEEGAAPKARVKTISRFEGERPRDEYETRARELAAVKTDRQRLTQHVSDVATQLAPHAPETVKHLTDSAQQAATFLASKLPSKPASPPGVVSLAPKMPAPSDQEVATFLRYARAVDDPMSVVDDLSKGKISREGVEALKAAYPSIYDQVRTKTMERVTALAGKGTPVPYAQRVEIGMLLDLPTDWSVTPDGIRTLQGIIAAAPANSQQGPQTQGPSRPTQTPRGMQMQTDVERREGGQIR